MFLNIEQVLEIYDDLLLAKENKKPTEIYINKFFSFSNNISNEENMREKKLAEDFHSLFHIFSKKHGVSVNINGVDMHQWICKIRSEELRFNCKIYIEVKNN